MPHNMNIIITRPKYVNICGELFLRELFCGRPSNLMSNNINVVITRSKYVNRSKKRNKDLLIKDLVSREKGKILMKYFYQEPNPII